VAPFAEIAARRTDDQAKGVHRPEGFAGIVQREEDAGCVYPARTSLLGQPEASEMLPGGPRFLASGVVPAEPKLLYTLTDAGIAGRDGVVYCPHARTAVGETVRRWTEPATSHPLLRALRFPPAQPLSGTSLSLASLDAEGFFHFLVEALPRLWLAREALASVQHVLVSGAREPSIEAWLARAGVAAEKIKWLEGHTHYLCEQLLFANLPLRDCQPTPWVRHALRQLLRPPPATASRWLWVSRRDAGKRHLAWEDELIGRFPRFEKVSLVGRAPADQLALFSGAEVVAGPHGAGLANLVFAPGGVRLIEFFQEGLTPPLYGRLAQVSGGQAAWAIVNFSQPPALSPLVAAMESFLAPAPAVARRHA
jgi:capsular polysaccharide biosynthesis protein